MSAFMRCRSVVPQNYAQQLPMGSDWHVMSWKKEKGVLKASDLSL